MYIYIYIYIYISKTLINLTLCLHGAKNPASYSLPLWEPSIYYCHNRLTHYAIDTYFPEKSK